MKKSDYAPVQPSGKELGEKITYEALLPYLKPFKLVENVVFAAGGSVNWEDGTEGDIDVIISRMPEEELIRRIHFRLGRSVPRELIQRLDVRSKKDLNEEIISPFTNYVALGDLVFQPKDDFEVVEMAIQKQRVAEEVRDQAEESLAEDAIEPFRFFYPLKPIRGAYPRKRQTVDSLLSLLEDEDFPLYSSVKKDGARHVIMKVGDEVRFYSDDGKDNTDSVSRLVERIRDIDVDSIVLDSEIEKWFEGMHYPREAAAGVIHSGEDEDLLINAFDVLYLNGEDLHDLPFERRWEMLQGLDFDQSVSGRPEPETLFNLIPHELVEDREELREIVEEQSEYRGSEGVVLKRADGPYPLTGDPGQTRAWFKFHLNVDCVVQVIEAIETKTEGVYVHSYGIPAESYEDLEPAEDRVVEVDGEEILKIGKTFMSDERFQSLTSILVEAETVNFVQEDGEYHITFWVPTLIESADQVPDTVSEIIDKAQENRVLQAKVREDDEVVYLPGLELTKIEDVETYDPTAVSDEVLSDDWRIVCAWYSSLSNGDGPYSEETILDLAEKILAEIYRRGEVTFHP